MCRCNRGELPEDKRAGSLGGAHDKFESGAALGGGGRELNHVGGRYRRKASGNAAIGITLISIARRCRNTLPRYE